MGWVKRVSYSWSVCVCHECGFRRSVSYMSGGFPPSDANVRCPHKGKPSHRKVIALKTQIRKLEHVIVCRKVDLEAITSPFEWTERLELEALILAQEESLRDLEEHLHQANIVAFLERFNHGYEEPVSIEKFIEKFRPYYRWLHKIDLHVLDSVDIPGHDLNTRKDVFKLLNRAVEAHALKGKWLTTSEKELLRNFLLAEWWTICLYFNWQRRNTS